MNAGDLEISYGPDGTAWNAAYEEMIASHGLLDFDSLMACTHGQIVKHAIATRATVRLHLADGCTVYLKRHYAPGFFSALASMLKGAAEPTALDEFENIVAFHLVNLPTVPPIAAGRRRAGMLQTESFLVTLALEGCQKLDEFLAQPLPRAAKRSLIAQTADLVSKMHACGFNHRDLYLCHILREGSGQLYIVDLHRVQRRSQVPERWLVKDIAALNYSAPRGIISRTDRLRFLKAYLGCSHLSAEDRRFALKVVKKTRKMLQHNKPGDSWR